MLGAGLAGAIAILAPAAAVAQPVSVAAGTALTIRLAGTPLKCCLDDSLIDAVGCVRAARHLDYPPFGEQRIAYILKTGANWAGPIGDFHLAIDKGDAKNLVSFCADGVRKSGPTRFEVVHRDFTPTRDLFILILTPLSWGPR